MPQTTWWGKTVVVRPYLFDNPKNHSSELCDWGGSECTLGPVDSSSVSSTLLCKKCHAARASS